MSLAAVCSTLGCPKGAAPHGRYCLDHEGPAARADRHRQDTGGSAIPCGLSGCTICSPEPMKVTIMHDSVNHPQHYTQHPSGVECITITEHMGFNLGNVLKYVWRADMKNGVEDLEKAAWYLQREIAKRKAAK